jgi:cell division protein FtsB
MAIEKVVNITTNLKGADKANQQVEKLNSNLKKVKATTGEVTTGMRDSGNAILENGGAMGILNDLTGGYAMTVKDAVEASVLFTEGTTIATTAQKIYTLAVGTTTGALKALRIALITTGIGAIIVLLGIFISKMAESAEATEEQKRQQEALNEALKRTSELYKQNIKDLQDVTNERILRAKIAGKSESELRKIEKDGRDERYKNYLAERNRLTEQLNDRKLSAENIKSINDQLTANQKEYFASVDADRIKDLEGELSVIEQRRQALEDARQKELEAQQKAREEAEKKRKEFEESVRQGQIDLQIATNNAEFEQNQLKIEEADRVQKALQQIAEEQTKIENEEAEKRKLFYEITEKSKVDITNNTFSLLSALAKKGSALAKAVAIADVIRGQVSAVSKIISNTAEANAKAVALSPLTAGQPFVGLNLVSAGLGIGASVAGAVKAIKDINSESQSASGGGAIGGGGASAPSAPSFNLVQGTGSNQIASSLANQRQPIQAYVTSGAVTNAQQLERNIVKDASL